MPHSSLNFMRQIHRNISFIPRHYTAHWRLLGRASPSKHNPLKSPSHFHTGAPTMSGKTHSEASSWDSHASSYTSTVERITRQPSIDLITRVNSLKPLDSPSARILDNGCGTGMLTAMLKSRFPSARVVAADISPGMVDMLSRNAEKHGWKDVETKVLDATQLSELSDETFSHVFSTFMIGSVEAPERAVAEMHRVTAPGGVIGISTWRDPTCWSVVWQDAVRSFEPEYEAPHIIHPDWVSGEATKRSMEKAGFREVVVWEVRSPWGWTNAREPVEYVFEGGNPIVQLLMEGWGKEEIEGRIRPEFERIVKEKWGDGRELAETAILAVGRK